MRTLEDHVRQAAASHPGHPAVICGDVTLTYGELWARVCARALTMRCDDERALVMRANQTPDFIVTYLAAHLAGKVMVPLEHDATERQVEDVSRVIAGSHVPAEVADILFTTGTTGRQKGTMISRRAILANAENLIDAQGFHGDLTFIICGPLNHIGSLSKIWPSLMVGATIVILDGAKDLGALFAAVRNAPSRAATFMVPSAIRMMLQFGKDELIALSGKIEFLETGAAPIAQSDMEAICRALPDSRLFNTYASTETGIIATHDFNHDACVAGCLGRTMKHSTLCISPDGLIRCSGDTVMTGYVGDDALTLSVLRDGVVYTRDRGEVDDAGRLHLTGRDDDIINCGGYKVNPVEVEDAAKAFAGIKDCICIESPHPVLGSVLGLLYVAENGCSVDVKTLGRHLAARLEKHKIPQMYAAVDAIARTYNGKLNRKYYRTRD